MFTRWCCAPAPGLPAIWKALSQLWRQKQLEFTWLRALMDRYQDFWQITEAALRTALAQLHMEASEPQVQQLLDAYLAPAVFPDAKSCARSSPRFSASDSLQRLAAPCWRPRFATMAWSPISPALFQWIQVKTYKPSPKVYQLGPDDASLCRPARFSSCHPMPGMPRAPRPSGIAFAGATDPAAMDHLGFAPDIVVSSLDQVPSRPNHLRHFVAHALARRTHACRVHTVQKPRVAPGHKRAAAPIPDAR